MARFLNLTRVHEGLLHDEYIFFSSRNYDLATLLYKFRAGNFDLDWHFKEHGDYLFALSELEAIDIEHITIYERKDYNLVVVKCSI